MSRAALLQRRGKRARRAAMTVWFFLLGVPTILFSLALSVDVSRMIVANRSVKLAAESAAVGAAFQFDESQNGQLDAGLARDDAYATLLRAEELGALKNVVIKERYAVADGGSVSLTVVWQLRRPLVIKYFLGRDGVVGGDVTARAFVCVPGVTTAPTRGNCARPD